MRRSLALAALLVLAAAPAASASAVPGDPLAAEIGRWRRFVRDHPGTGEEWTALRGAVEPALREAEVALAEGRRWQALARLVAARAPLAAEAFRAALPEAARGDLASLEAEWRRRGPELSAPLTALAPAGLDRLPAAARAVAEAALSEVGVYYQASLDYGRNTVAEAGFYYLGAAAAQLELARFCATLGAARPAGSAPALRSLAPELEALEGELLAAYRPPASIDRHPAFIRASALLKQARELDAAGLRHGALYRLLEARLRVSLLTRSGDGTDPELAGQRARARLAELDAAPGDRSLERLFVESALGAAADPAPEARGAETARAILEEVLPLHAAATGPAPPAPAQRPAEVTVTLVRWPYT